MELKSNLAKELFDKVIIPIQNKNKTTITSIVPPNNTVSNTETLLPVSISPIIKDEQKDELNTSLPEQLTTPSDTTLPSLLTSSSGDTVNIMPPPIPQEPILLEPIPQEPVSTEVIQEPKPEISKDNMDVTRLVQILLGVLRKPEVPILEKPVQIEEQTEEKKDIASCDINERCEEQPLKQLVNALSKTLSKPPPSAGDGDTTVSESTKEVAENETKFNLPKLPSIDMSGKLNWITQSLAALFATIGGLFTFEPVQDTDPYELMEDKKNQGYIYVGKMYMKPEDANTKPESVKYISYNPQNKDFFIDERKEV